MTLIKVFVTMAQQMGGDIGKVSSVQPHLQYLYNNSPAKLDGQSR
jgi:hypothetical protein